LGAEYRRRKDKEAVKTAHSGQTAALRPLVLDAVINVKSVPVRMRFIRQKILR